MSKVSEVRFDSAGEIRLMARAQNWVMVRRKGCIPFTMMEKEWNAMRRTHDAPWGTPHIPPTVTRGMSWNGNG